MANDAHGDGNVDIEAALHEARRVYRLLERIAAWEARQLEWTKRQAEAQREATVQSASPEALRLLRTAGRL